MLTTLSVQIARYQEKRSLHRVTAMYSVREIRPKTAVVVMCLMGMGTMITGRTLSESDCGLCGRVGLLGKRGEGEKRATERKSRSW